MEWEAIGAIAGIASLIVTIIIEWPRLGSLLSGIKNIFVRVLLGAAIIGFSGAVVLGIIGAIIGAIIHATGSDVTITIGDAVWAEASGKTDNAVTIGFVWSAIGAFWGSLIGAVIGLFYRPRKSKKN